MTIINIYILYAMYPLNIMLKIIVIGASELEVAREREQTTVIIKKKNKVTARIPQIEEYVLKMFEDAESNNDGLTGPFVRTKALQYAKTLGHDNFSASKGWLLSRIFYRHC